MDDSATTPVTTPVVLLRNLPANTSPRDVADACSPYGTVLRLFVAHVKHMAFVQLDSVDAARRLVNASAAKSVAIFGSLIEVLASTKPEVSGQFSEPPFSDTPAIRSSKTSAPGGRQALGRDDARAPAAARRDRDAPEGRRPREGRAAGDDESALPPLADRRVLLVQLHALGESVSMDEFQTALSHFGTVLRMTYFVKNGQNLLLVEYADHAAAERALAVLRDCRIELCTFTAEWSRLRGLTFSTIDTRNRDYSVLEAVRPTERALHAKSELARVAASGASGSSGRFEDRGGRGAARGGQRADFPEDGHSATIRGRGSERGPRADGRRDREEEEDRQGGARRGGRHVLFVSRVPAGVAAAQLLRLFGQYGDVVLVRMLYGKPDQALVEMGSADTAHIAREKLDELPLMGGVLRVSSSKFDSLKAPQPGAEDAALCAGPLLRSATAVRIVAPNVTLHVSSIVPEVGATEATRGALRDRIARYGTIEAEEWLPPSGENTRWMARFRMETLEAAAACVAFLHHTMLLDRAVVPQQPYTKVAFAQRPLTS